MTGDERGEQGAVRVPESFLACSIFFLNGYGDL